MDNANTENRGDDKYIYVRSEELLYKIADSGNLDQLEEIVHEKKYKFRVTPDVKEVCDKFFAEKEAEKKSKKVKQELDHKGIINLG
ncbi:hypothetical protein [Enterococcus sp.]|uniref:hypothetical protein n=1 Tax=Enterococcus sp. TaxID=35783 RepID=UPI0028A0D399|nr:hypothetical protein [Enterococcus sp.]